VNSLVVCVGAMQTPSLFLAVGRWMIAAKRFHNFFAKRTCRNLNL
jgi:hypothetical protein